MSFSQDFPKLPCHNIKGRIVLSHTINSMASKTIRPFFRVSMTSDSNTDITVPSSYFAGIISQLQIFGDTIEFNCSEEKVQLSSLSAESGKMIVDIDVDDLNAYSITEDEPEMKISFSL
ncbi:hypothetical protein, partial [uncultured Psychrobacter sp.]|uniref:hypothetical protein n=1 Tax=uncultured Psychrobacter sp. TaxID=259303 RepID=UPI0032B2EBE4